MRGRDFGYGPYLLEVRHYNLTDEVTIGGNTRRGNQYSEP